MPLNQLDNLIIVSRGTCLKLLLKAKRISRKFDEVLHSVYLLSIHSTKPRDPEFRTMHPWLQGPQFLPCFDNCIGAIDGTHVKVVVPSDKVIQHVGQHGYATQNVLVICDFNMRFTFAVV